MRRAALKPHATFHYTVQEIVLLLLVQRLHIVDDGRGVVGRSGSRCVVVVFFLFVALTSLACRSGLNESRPLCPPPRPSAPFAAAAATILDWTILCLVTLAAALEAPALIQSRLAFFLAQTSAISSSASSPLLLSERDHVDVHGIGVSLRLLTLWSSQGISSAILAGAEEIAAVRSQAGKHHPATLDFASGSGLPFVDGGWHWVALEDCPM